MDYLAVKARISTIQIPGTIPSDQQDTCVRILSGGQTSSEPCSTRALTRHRPARSLHFSASRCACQWLAD